MEGTGPQPLPEDPGPSHAPGEPAPPRVPPGCAKPLAIACGGILVLGAIAAAAVYLKFGAVIPSLEASYVRNALALSGAQPELKDKVEGVLEDYERAARGAGLTPQEWWDAGRAFEQSPAVAALGIQVALAGLPRVKDLRPEEEERARSVLQSIGRGLVEGKISPEEYRGLLARARGDRAPAGKDEVRIQAAALGADELRRLFDEAEKVAADRGVAAGPFLPDLPALLRSDLLKSLAEGKRARAK